MSKHTLEHDYDAALAAEWDAMEPVADEIDEFSDEPPKAPASRAAPAAAGAAGSRSGSEPKRDAGPKTAEATYAESLSWVEPKMLIEGLLPWNGFTQNYGARKSLKTFVTLDMALCVATGIPYHGHAVQRQIVTYVAAEGGKSRFRDRVTAWLKLNEIDPAELAGWFYMVNRPVNLTDANARTEFINGLRGGRRRGLIVFDTVSKNSGGMDEDTKGMKLFCHGANVVRLATGAAVLVVHHEGKDAAKKGRGSTVLPGDVDMSLRTVKSGHGRSTLSVDESRDTEEGLALTFKLEAVDIGGGQVAAACRFVAERRAGSRTPDEQALVEIAESEGLMETPAALIDKEVKGRSHANVYKIVARLRKQGLVEPEGALRVTDQGRRAAVELGAVLFDDED